MCYDRGDDEYEEDFNDKEEKSDESDWKKQDDAQRYRDLKS